jgi:hypothetical protein
MTDFYNTTHETGEKLAHYHKVARTQQEAILLFFVGNPHLWPPHAVRFLVFKDRVPLTSVRRALTNLTKAGKLRKSKFKVMGAYGRKVYTWGPVIAEVH